MLPSLVLFCVIQCCVIYSLSCFIIICQILGKDDDDDENDEDDEDDDEAVTHTTVKTSSCSAGASADPSNLYATISKPKK